MPPTIAPVLLRWVGKREGDEGEVVSLPVVGLDLGAGCCGQNYHRNALEFQGLLNRAANAGSLHCVSLAL